MGYLLVVGILPVVGVGGAVALLTSAFSRAGQPRLFRVLGASGLLVSTGLWIFVTATGGGYSIVAAAQELIVATAAALVGAIVLIVKAPRARRVAALLLITAYPLMLIGLAQAGSMLSPDARFVVIKTTH
jgi:hypothetical protein